MLFSGTSRAPPRWATYVTRGRESTVRVRHPTPSGFAGPVRASETTEATEAEARAVVAIHVTMSNTVEVFIVIKAVMTLDLGDGCVSSHPSLLSAPAPPERGEMGP